MNHYNNGCVSGYPETHPSKEKFMNCRENILIFLQFASLFIFCGIVPSILMYVCISSENINPIKTCLSILGIVFSIIIGIYHFLTFTTILDIVHKGIDIF